jgi:hypothetical protein
MTIEDPNGRVQDRVVGVPAGPVNTGNLSFGLMNGGRYEPARLMSVASGVRTYYVAVPKNSSYRLIMSTGLTFSGAAAQVASGASPTATLPVSTGGADVTIDLGVVQ